VKAVSTVTTEERLAVLALVAEHAWRNDHGQADRLWELVTEKYTSDGPMGTMAGRDALRAWGAKRVLNPSKVRHVISNTRVFREDGDLRATSYYVAFRDTGTNPSIPASMGEYHDRFELVDGEWLLAERNIVPVFVNPDAPRPVIGASSSATSPAGDK
jgi:SnoaL-like domain